MHDWADDGDDDGNDDDDDDDGDDDRAEVVACALDFTMNPSAMWAL